METSTCSSCSRSLPVSAFYWQKDKGRPHAWCKECYRDWHRRRYTPKVPVADTLACTVCGTEFRPKQRRPTAFCSQHCRNQARIQTEKALRKARTEALKCEWCGSALTYRPGKASRSKYCSDKCQWKAGHARRTPEERAAYRFLRKYGITIKQRDAMLAKQGGCAICGTTERSAKGWVIDHDHACCSGAGATDARTCGGCIRGVLCQRCNLAIGLFDDSPERLRAAAKYLTRKRKPK